MLIVVISEVSKRSSFIGALLASLPVVSLLAILWLYIETRDVEKISALATSVFWLVLPSLVLFITLPILLKWQIPFYISLGLSITLTVISYGLLVVILNYYGVKL